MFTNTITFVCCCIIGGAFLFFLFYAMLIWLLCSNTITNAEKEENILDVFLGSRLRTIANEYRKTINIDINGEVKTNEPACEYFTEFGVCNAYIINTRLVDAASATLVGLGLFGTFLGLTVGIQGFDSSTTDGIQASIQALLSGMGAAFYTSLVGMGASLIYTLFEKTWRNGLAKRLLRLNQRLDDIYYIDDVELAAYNQKLVVEQVASTISEELKSLLHYTNAEGQQVPVANAVREILTNNEEQTKALKSFSSDLALELNDRLDETLSRQMQQRLVPLMESIDATSKSMVEHIDQMASSIQSPATDMIKQVMDDLKASLMGIMEQFRSTLSKNATEELENLALSLGEATNAMAEFPQTMAGISDQLNRTMSEVHSAIEEISNSTAAANSSAMKEMQDQIALVTNAIGEAIAEVKDVMTGITQSSDQTLKKLIEEVAKSSADTADYMQSTMAKISEAMHSTVQSMSDDIVGKQTDLLALQEDTTSEVKRVVAELSEAWKLSSEAIIEQTARLLARFDSSIEHMDSTNTAVSGTMDLFQQAQTSISGTTSHLHMITGDMKTATEAFRRGQSEYTLGLEKAQRETESRIKEVVELIETAGVTSDEFAQKFELIRKGLSDIFAQIQKGLQEYTNAVGASLQRYLGEYSNSLTETTDALKTTIERQNETVEMLVDALNDSTKK